MKNNKIAQPELSNLLSNRYSLFSFPAERVDRLPTVGKYMNASLYLSNIMDRYRLFENLTSPPIPEKRIIALDA